MTAALLSRFLRRPDALVMLSEEQARELNDAYVSMSDQHVTNDLLVAFLIPTVRLSIRPLVIANLAIDVPPLTTRLHDMRMCWLVPPYMRFLSVRQVTQERIDAYAPDCTVRYRP